MHEWLKKVKEALKLELCQIHHLSCLAMMAPNEAAMMPVLDIMDVDLQGAMTWNCILCAFCDMKPVGPPHPGIPVCPPEMGNWPVCSPGAGAGVGAGAAGGYAPPSGPEVPYPPPFLYGEKVEEPDKKE